MNHLQNVNNTNNIQPGNLGLVDNVKRDQMNSFENNSTGNELTLKNIQQLNKKVEDIHHFIKSLSNLKISNQTCVTCIKLLIDPKIYADFCVAVSNNGNKTDGEKLLSNNFRACLSLRDSQHASPLDKLVDHFNNQIAIHQAIYAIRNLEKTLLSYKEEKSKGIPTACMLRIRAVSEFKHLPSEAMGTLCRKLWELDNCPNQPAYGYNTAVNDILQLLEHNSCPVIEDSLVKLDKNTEASFNYEIKTIFPEQMTPSDPLDLFEEIQKAHQLRDLKAYLNDNTKTNEFLFAKYEQMHPKIKELLGHLIWLAYDKPNELGFSDNKLKANMRILFNLQNSQGVDIVSQLISHTSEKVTLRRETSGLGQIRFDKFTTFYDLCRTGITPSDLLQAYDQLDEVSKKALRYQVWFQGGGEKDQNFQAGNLGYGENTIRNNPLIIKTYGSSQFIHFAAWKMICDRKNALEKNARNWNQLDKILIDDFDRKKSLPKDPIEVTTKIFEEQRKQGLLSPLSEDQSVTFVTAELKDVASTGGLAAAVKGMVDGNGAKKARVIMPLYRNGPIDTKLINTMQETKYDICVNGKKAKILKANIGDIRCYFVDLPELLSDGKIYWDEGKADYNQHQKRWVHFQKAAADLSYLFSKRDSSANLVHVHDVQTALVPKFLASHHPEEWARGETPATVFTFHNNEVKPNIYEGHNEKALSSLEETGLPRQGTNPFIEALIDADMVTTVSERFGKEAQDPSFGNEMHDFVKRAALKGKLVGIVNGNNTAEWDPNNGKLKDWVSCLPANEGQKIDLSFGPHLSDKELAENTIIMQEELCAYLKKQPQHNIGVDSAYADLDPKKPIVMYVGRYDAKQKGIGKLPLIMEEVLNGGGQFICVGTGPTKEADEILTRMQNRANELGHKGVLILKDKTVQNHEGKNVLKFQSVIGPLLRGAATLGVFPSSYEPCGLVQGEFNSYGKKAIATKTGGFGDTLNETNGYLFERHSNWDSFEQNESIKKTLDKALNDAKALQEALYSRSEEKIAPFMQEKRTMMNNALNSTWTTSRDPSILAPIERMKLVYAKALENRKLRWKIDTDLNTFKA